MHSSRQEITMRKKTKTIQEDLGIFTQILVYSGIFRHVQQLFKYIQANSEYCVRLAYSEFWNIGNQKLRHQNPI